MRQVTSASYDPASQRHTPPPTSISRTPLPQATRPRSNSDGETAQMSYPSQAPLTQTVPGVQQRAISRSGDPTLRDSDKPSHFQQVVLKSTNNRDTLWQDNSPSNTVSQAVKPPLAKEASSSTTQRPLIPKPPSVPKPSPQSHKQPPPAYKPPPPSFAPTQKPPPPSGPPPSSKPPPPAYKPPQTSPLQKPTIPTFVSPKTSPTISPQTSPTISRSHSSVTIPNRQVPPNRSFTSPALSTQSKKPTLRITVVSTETAFHKKEFTVYVLKVETETSSWTIVRRYKAIHSFAHKLHNQFIILEPLFPAKKLVGNMEPDFIRRRKEQLQNYVNKIVAIQEVCTSALFSAFIDEYSNPTLATLNNRVKSGVLRLQVTILSARKKFKERFFICQGEYLFGFLNDKDMWLAAKDSIPLRNCRIRTVQKDELFTFEIVQPDDSNTVLLCADTASQRHEWMTVLLAQSKPPVAAPISNHPAFSNRPGVRVSFSLKGQTNKASLSFDNSVNVKGVKSTLAEITQVPEQEGERYGLAVTKGDDDMLWLDDSDNPLNDFDMQNFNVLTYEKVPKKIHRLLKAASSTNIQVALKGKAPNSPQPQITLMPGENIKLSINDVIHLHANGGIVGSFTLTTYQLIFSPYTTSGGVKCDTEGFKLPLGNISHIIRCGGVTCDTGRFYCFEIRSKDINFIRFTYTPSVSTSAPINITAAIAEVAFPANPRSSFTFNSKEPHNVWTKMDHVQYYKRLGLPDKQWRITTINNNYLLSNVYPAVIAVPAVINDTDLLGIAPFRSKGRIPALVWKSPKGMAIVRCSQPVVGVTGKRSFEDEKMFEAIRLANPNSDVLYIIDVRPQLNAVANQVCGMGYEKEYKDCVVKFMGIQNIHHMRESYQRLNKAIRNHTNITMVKEAVKGWLFHIKAVLTAASQVVKLIAGGASVVVHCSDGWDRTPQVTSLCKIILDGHYRTIDGFIQLVEVDWLSFGHKFMERVGYFSPDYKDDQQAPIFIQFLDCVYQIIAQHPQHFQYNEEFLREIATHVYSLRFGTFLYNTEKERVDSELSKHTQSLWTYLLRNRAQYTNKSYVSSEGQLRYDPQQLISFWKFHSLWLHHHEGVMMDGLL